MYYYVGTAQPATAVFSSLVAHFTNTSYTTSHSNFSSATPKNKDRIQEEPSKENYDLNLILNNGTNLKIYKATPDGLVILNDIDFFGRINVLLKISDISAERKRDLLFFVNENYQCGLLKFHNGEIITLSKGEVSETTGNSMNYTSWFSFADYKSRFIALSIYNGVLKIIPLATTNSSHNSEIISGMTTQHPFNLKLKYANIKDIVQIYGKSYHPEIGFLYLNRKNEIVFKVCELYLEDWKLKRPTQNPWKILLKDTTLHKVIPLQNGGIIMISSLEIHYYSYQSSRPSSTVKLRRSCLFTEVGKIDEMRYLLGNNLKELHLLGIEEERKKVRMEVEFLGEIPIPSSLNYIDNGVVYVGSKTGPPTILRLLSSKSQSINCPYIDIIETHENMAPILDFEVVDLNLQGECEIISCSGYGKDSQLKLLREGIHYEIMGTVQMNGIIDIFQAQLSYKEGLSTCIILSFLNQTKFLAFSRDDSIEEIIIPGMDSEATTLYSSNIGPHSSHIIQVTPNKINYVSSSSLQQELIYLAPSTITLGDSTFEPSGLITALAGGELHYFNLENLEKGSDPSLVRPLNILKFENEISALILEGEIGYISFWRSQFLRIISFQNNSYSIICCMKLDGQSICKSIETLIVENQLHILCGMADGFLQVFQIQENQSLSKYAGEIMQDIEEKKIIDDSENSLKNTDILKANKLVNLGTYSVKFVKLLLNGKKNIFAIGDCPCIIYSQFGKLSFSHLTSKRISVEKLIFLAVTGAIGIPGSDHSEILVLISEGNFLVGSIQIIQKMLINSIPMGLQCNKVSFDPQSNSLLVLNSPVACPGCHLDPSNIIVFNKNSMVQEDMFQLEPKEIAATIKIYSDPSVSHSNLAIVGTSFVLENEKVPTKGRILIFSMSSSNQLSLIYSKVVQGGVTSISQLHQYLLITINSGIFIFGLQIPFHHNQTIYNQIQNQEIITNQKNKNNQPARSLIDSFQINLFAQKEGSVYCVSTATSPQKDSYHFVVADLISSAGIYVYNENLREIQILGRCQHPIWSISIFMIDSTHCLLSDDSNDLFALELKNKTHKKKNTQSKEFCITDIFHLGDQINKMEKGSLIMESIYKKFNDINSVTVDLQDHLAKKESFPLDISNNKENMINSFFYGTSSGAIGIIKVIPERTFIFLNALQSSMNQIVQGIGELTYGEWRFPIEKKNWKPFTPQFIDGNFVELFLQMESEIMEQILHNMNYEESDESTPTLKETITLLNQLSKIH